MRKKYREATIKRYYGFCDTKANNNEALTKDELSFKGSRIYDRSDANDAIFKSRCSVFVKSGGPRLNCMMGIKNQGISGYNWYVTINSPDITFTVVTF
ncbi:MAG TPA: hypothetical protein VJR94_03745 [Candidatus Nitrosocosmicus sp.]|nr:hypothetical protein [Candidatus Nitrosocosmicus sp.]